MILLYHHVAADSPPSTDPLPDEAGLLRISPRGLEAHLRELQRRGFRFVPLPEMVETIRRTGQEPRRSVAITFDDGWRDTFDNAVPILRNLGLTATFFLTTEHLRAGRDDPRKMTPSQIRELASAGMTIGGHSRSHPDLTRMSGERAFEEIAGCKADLEGAIGGPVTCFAYPGGEFNRTVADLARRAGYEAACSVLGPAANDRSSLFWLYRDPLSERMNTPGDLYRLSPWARRLLGWRVRRKLRLMLQRG